MDESTNEPTYLPRTVTPDGLALYDNEYGTLVSLDSGVVECSCMDWDCRRRPQARTAGVMPDIGSVKYHCKHIKRAVADCIRRGDVILTLRSWVRPPRQGGIYEREYRQQTQGREELLGVPLEGTGEGT